MAVTQLVFTGVSAFVGDVTGPTQVKFYVEEHEFDPTKRIAVDLAKNPDNVAPAAWGTDVDVDMFKQFGGWTTIGPSFHGGVHVGGVYLAQRLVPADIAWPPPGDALYQYQALLRDDNGTKTRYHGFKVRVMSPSSGTLAHLGFIPVGASAPTGGVYWIDLADPTVSDPQANGFTTITPSSPAGTVGALFLTASGMATLAKKPPKYPAALGW